mgnify:CR=1 FL=1
MLLFRPFVLICGLLFAASALFAQGSFPQSAPSTPRDGAYAFGQFVLNIGTPDRAALVEHVRSWTVKGDRKSVV